MDSAVDVARRQSGVLPRSQPMNSDVQGVRGPDSRSVPTPATRDTGVYEGVRSSVAAISFATELRSALARRALDLSHRACQPYRLPDAGA